MAVGLVRLLRLSLLTLIFLLESLCLLIARPSHMTMCLHPLLWVVLVVVGRVWVVGYRCGVGVHCGLHCVVLVVVCGGMVACVGYAWGEGGRGGWAMEALSIRVLHTVQIRVNTLTCVWSADLKYQGRMKTRRLEVGSLTVGNTPEGASLANYLRWAPRSWPLEVWECRVIGSPDAHVWQRLLAGW